MYLIALEQKKHIKQPVLENRVIKTFSEVDNWEGKTYGIDMWSWNGVIDW